MSCPARYVSRNATGNLQRLCEIGDLPSNVGDYASGFLVPDATSAATRTAGHYWLNDGQSRTESQPIAVDVITSSPHNVAASNKIFPAAERLPQGTHWLLQYGAIASSFDSLAGAKH